MEKQTKEYQMIKVTKDSYLKIKELNAKDTKERGDNVFIYETVEQIINKQLGL
jgi:hypothetical protein